MKTFALLITLVAFAFQDKDLSPRVFDEKIHDTPDAVVLDVRTADEVAQGIIPNAISIDFYKDDFENQLKKLDKSKTYFVYCGSGVRSTKAINLMEELGFKKYYNLDGGMKAWKASGMKVVKK